MKYKFFILCLLILFSSGESQARNGCCSHHGGQKKCDPKTGRMICMDNRFSPSCTCDDMPYIDIKKNIEVFKEKSPAFIWRNRTNYNNFIQMSSCKHLYVK